MAKKGLKCPKCGTVMLKRTNTKFTDPFEVGYHCPKCDTNYTFSDWTEYYELCEWEQKEKKKKEPRPFNPSVRGSMMKGES